MAHAFCSPPNEPSTEAPPATARPFQKLLDSQPQCSAERQPRATPPALMAGTATAFTAASHKAAWISRPHTEALAPTVEPDRFSGDRLDAVNTVVDFVEAMTVFLESHGLLDAVDSPALAARYLTGGARVWYRSRKQENSVRFASWQAMSSALLQRFGSANSATCKAAFGALINLRQTGSVQGYTRKYRQLMSRCHHSYLTPAVRLYLFLHGLRPEMQVQVQLQQPADFEAAADLAATVDRVYTNSRAPSHSSQEHPAQQRRKPARQARKRRDGLAAAFGQPEQPRLHQQLLPVPDVPWQHISMDLVTALPLTPAGNDAIVVFIDRLSQMLHLVPVHKNISGERLARVLASVIKLHGVPESIVCDPDPRFTSSFWQALLQRFGISLHFRKPANSQSDDPSEEAIDTITIMETLHSYIQPNSNDWDQDLFMFEMTYNNTEHASTQLAPFEVVLGRRVRDFDTAVTPSSQPQPGSIRRGCCLRQAPAQPAGSCKLALQGCYARARSSTPTSISMTTASQLAT